MSAFLPDAQASQPKSANPHTRHARRRSQSGVRLASDSQTAVGVKSPAGRGSAPDGSGRVQGILKVNFDANRQFLVNRGVVRASLSAGRLTKPVKTSVIVRQVDEIEPDRHAGKADTHLPVVRTASCQTAPLVCDRCQRALVGVLQLKEAIGQAEERASFLSKRRKGVSTGWQSPRADNCSPPVLEADDMSFGRAARLLNDLAKLTAVLQEENEDLHDELVRTKLDVAQRQGNVLQMRSELDREKNIYKEQLYRLQGELSDMERGRTAATVEHAERMRRLEGRLSEADKFRVSAENQWRSAKELCEELEMKLAVHRMDQADREKLAQSKEELENSVQLMEAALKRFAQDVADRDTKLEELTTKMKETRKEVDDLSKKHELLLLDIETLKTTRRLLEDERSRLTDELSMEKDERRVTEKKLVEVQEHCREAADQLDRAEKVIHLLAEKIQEREDKVSDLQNTIKTLETEVEEAKLHNRLLLLDNAEPLTLQELHRQVDTNTVHIALLTDENKRLRTKQAEFRRNPALQSTGGPTPLWRPETLRRLREASEGDDSAAKEMRARMRSRKDRWRQENRQGIEPGVASPERVEHDGKDGKTAALRAT